MQEVDGNPRFWQKPELARQAAAFESGTNADPTGEEYIVAAQHRTGREYLLQREVKIS
jgi:hypothetical protein